MIASHIEWCVPILRGLIYEFRLFTRKFDTSTSFLTDNAMEILPKIFSFETVFETDESGSYTMEHIRVLAIDDIYSSA